MVIKDYKKVGISRAKSWIVNALMKLLKENSLDIITITEICQEADIVRATFYRNFDSKEDILKLYIRILINDYFTKLKETSCLDLKNLSLMYFTYWKGEKEVLDILLRNNQTILLLDEYNIVEKYIMELNPEAYILKNQTEAERLYSSSFLFAGLWRLVFLWIDRELLESPEEMAEIFLQFKL